jgi:hypothetical protein
LDLRDLDFATEHVSHQLRQQRIVMSKPARQQDALDWNARLNKAVEDRGGPGAEFRRAP